MRILVVDDEPRVASFVSRAIAAAGYGVDIASDGTRGLALAQTGIYDLVVLDLNLPRMDGRSVLREVLRSRPGQQVLILSAHHDVRTKVECLELGAGDYVEKPFVLAELLARIAARLPTRPPSLMPESVLLEGKARVAYGRHGAVSLSHREFLLLQFLMRNVGTVCTRDELLADVWGYWFDPGTNVVDVYIHRLRAKVGEACIETVRNVGYRYCPPPADR